VEDVKLGKQSTTKFLMICTRKNFMPNKIIDALQTLGFTEESIQSIININNREHALTQIKQAYRERIIAIHPDKSKEKKALANAETAKLLEAHKFLKQEMEKNDLNTLYRKYEEEEFSATGVKSRPQTASEAYNERYKQYNFSTKIYFNVGESLNEEIKVQMELMQQYPWYKCGFIYKLPVSEIQDEHLPRILHALHKNNIDYLYRASPTFNGIVIQIGDTNNAADQIFDPDVAKLVALVGDKNFKRKPLDQEEKDLLGLLKFKERNMEDMRKETDLRRRCSPEYREAGVAFEISLTFTAETKALTAEQYSGSLPSDFEFEDLHLILLNQGVAAVAFPVSDSALTERGVLGGLIVAGPSCAIEEPEAYNNFISLQNQYPDVVKITFDGDKPKAGYKP
jgi:curved DNA-binding protein CbpA